MTALLLGCGLCGVNAAASRHVQGVRVPRGKHGYQPMKWGAEPVGFCVPCVGGRNAADLVPEWRVYRLWSRNVCAVRGCPIVRAGLARPVSGGLVRVRESVSMVDRDALGFHREIQGDRAVVWACGRCDREQLWSAWVWRPNVYAWIPFDVARDRERLGDAVGVSMLGYKVAVMTRPGVLGLHLGEWRGWAMRVRILPPRGVPDGVRYGRVSP